MKKDHFLLKNHSMRYKNPNPNLVEAKLRFSKKMKKESLMKIRKTKELHLSILSNLIWNLFTLKKPKIYKRKRREN
jgi:hypothetical protein